MEQRRTLALVFVSQLDVNLLGSQWQGTIVNAQGLKLSNLSITDPVFVQKLVTGYPPVNPCLVTISLGIPWRPPNWEGDDPCWKLIAGVIELQG